MKKVSLAMLGIASLLVYSSCKKQTTTEETAPAQQEIRNAPVPAAPCGTKYLDLVIDPATGGSFLYVVYNSPSNPPVTVNTVNGSAGNNQIGSSSLATTVFKMTGLSFDPATSTCYGITGNGGSHPNSLIKFNVGDPNVVGIAPLITPFANMNLSDIERNPWNGRYYAVDRANNRLVTINVGTGAVTYLPNVLGFSPAGLAMDCGGKIYLMRMGGANGNVYVADPNTGGVILGPCAYPGPIIPGPVIGLNTEMGLHFDCDCTFRLVTGNFSGASFQLTDGLPTCLGGPVYTALPNSIKPTVDFSRLN